MRQKVFRYSPSPQISTTLETYWNSKIEKGEVQLTALRWISEFIVYGKEKLLPYCAPILGAFLPSVAHQIRDIFLLPPPQMLFILGT